MNSKTLFGAVVILVLVNLASAKGRAGTLGQRPKCTDIVQLVPVVNEVADAVLQSPCEIVTCLLNFTCEKKCESPLLTTVLSLLESLIAPLVCDDGLIVCPDHLAVESCLSSSGRKSILGV